MAVFKIAFIGSPDQKSIAEIAQQKFGWREGQDSEIELVDITGMSKKEILEMGALQGILYYNSIRSNEEHLQQLEDVMLSQENIEDLSLFPLTDGRAGPEIAKEEQEALAKIYSKKFSDVTPEMINADPANVQTEHEIESYFKGVISPVAQMHLQTANEPEKTAEAKLDKLVQMIIDATEQKHDYTAGHVDRVSKYSEAIAREMGMSEEQIREVSLSARLHDIGKIVVSDGVLAKPSDLSYVEKIEMGEHTEQGVAILRTVLARAPELAKYITPEVIKGVGYHHKDWNGMHGRREGEPPDEIRGNKVGDCALTLQVADCIDAMTSQRAYNNPKHVLEMFRDLQKNKGVQFKPEIAEAAMIVFAKEIASLGIDPLKLVADEPPKWNVKVDSEIKAFLEANADKFEVNKEAEVGAYGKLGFRLDASGHLEFEGKHAPERDLNIPYQDKVKFKLMLAQKDLKEHPVEGKTELTVEDKEKVEQSAYGMIMGDEKEGINMMERAAIVPPVKVTATPITERVTFREIQEQVQEEVKKPQDPKANGEKSNPLTIEEPSSNPVKPSLASQIANAVSRDNEYNMANVKEANKMINEMVRGDNIRETRDQDAVVK